MPENNFVEWIAERYERLWPELHEAGAIEPVVDFLERLSGGQAALEFGIGTGRIGVPLSRRGIAVDGIELSEAMAGRIKRQPGGDAVGVTIGDFATASSGKTYALV
ncbi:MAG TPA: class I SAM-dependent methyltransferase, partial [Tepidiformaceae bacterium]|nr:class I SAM-dependent methyltransferase [Tepidiformaceae bacterium]